MTVFTKKGAICFLLLILSMVSPHVVFAGDVLINEFLVDPDSNQWVELYNKGSNSADISGWFIDDSGGTQKFIIPASTSINPGELKVFESGYFNLNRTSADTVRLLNGDILVDSYSYNTGPGPNSSFGRVSDGGDSWVVFNTPTKGSSNNTSSPAPTSTPTPTPTVFPTSVPTATTIPVKSPTPIKIPTATFTITQSPLQKTSSSTTVLHPTQESITGIRSNTVPTAILGVNIVASDSPTVTTSLTEGKKKSGNSSNLPSIAFVAVGGVMIAFCGILTFRSYRKTKDDSKSSGMIN